MYLGCSWNQGSRGGMGMNSPDPQGPFKGMKKGHELKHPKGFHLGVFFPPKSSIFNRVFSMIFTIHFGVITPIFGETPPFVW